MSDNWKDKILKMGLGWFVAGPVGAVLGAILDNFYSNDENTLEDIPINEGEEQAIYHAYLVSLFVYIAKADGKLSPVEIRIIRDFFKRKGASEQEMIQIREALKVAARIKNIKIKEITEQINMIFDYDTKLNILELCYHIAAADNLISPEESERLTEIASLMKISITDLNVLEMKYGFESIDRSQKEKKIDEELERLKREMRGEKFNNKDSQSNHNSNRQSRKNGSDSGDNRKKSYNFDKPWEILGVSENASYKEIKRAYIKLQRIYHPDINPSKEAEEKIKNINIAYDILKKKFE